MSGLIWAGIGQGISNAGQTIGSTMTRAIERDMEAERRRLEKEEDRALRLQIAQENNQIRADLAAGRAGGTGGSGGGGAGLRPMSEEDRDLEALQLGMNRPDYDAFIQAQRTGDTTPLMRPTQRVAIGESGDPYNPEVSSETVKDYPPGFDKFLSAKQSQLARIREERQFGSSYKNVAEGRGVMQGVDAAQGIMDEQDPAKRAERAGLVGTAIAAREGKPIYTVKGDTSLQQFTGGSDTTEVGDSKIRRNDRPPAARAAGGSGGGSAADPDLKVLQQMRMAAQAELTVAERALATFDMTMRDLPSRERQARAGDRDALMTRIGEARSSLSDVSRLLARRLPPADREPRPDPKPDPKPAPASSEAPKSRSYSHLWK